MKHSLRHTKKFALSLLLGAAVFATVSICAVRAQNANEAAPQTAINVLRDATLKNLNGELSTNWTAFEGGYTIAVGQAREGGNAIVVERQEGEAARGASQNIVLEQIAPAPITISGWSRAENVGGAPDGEYSLYADVVYSDGTTTWGVNAPIETGTHDWQRVEFVITPDKPVKSLTVYALFRNHTGKAWFSDLSVLTTPRIVPAAPMAEVEMEKKFAPRPYRAAPDAKLAALPPAPTTLSNKLINAGFEESENAFPRGWQKWASGGTLANGEGRNGGAALVCERAEDDPERGAQQQIALNQTQREPILVEGWSRAENVSGVRDGEYSLYADIVYADGTTLWGTTSGFATGTHDWQRAQFTINAEKPIKTLTIYALFRGHTGKVWFDDFGASTRKVAAGATFFDGAPVQIPAEVKAVKNAAAPAATKDGLSLQLDAKSGAVTSLRVDEREMASGASGGFLARDVANSSGYYNFQNGASAPLKLKLDSKITAEKDHLVIAGRVEDTTKLDRAISLVFALPLDARGWAWDDDIRASQTIGRGEYSQTAQIGSGSSGGQSVYPVANIRDEKSGLALALDMDFPAQYRLGYNAETRQFFIAYDFGLTEEKPRADFRFIVYRSNSQWGFRDAAAKLYRIFPGYFAVPEAAKKQGLWMPFNAIGSLEKPEDFGFRFREAGANALTDGSAAWDDAHDVLTLLYSEPMTYWMSMPPDMPRTYDDALNELRRLAADPKHANYRQARAVIASGMRYDAGKLVVIFQNQPWGNGAVWSMNPSPNLDAASTRESPSGASLVWNKEKLARLKNTTGARVDGEYLDSLEGYVTADLNFARDQFAAAQTPLTFSTSDFTPALHKAFSTHEMTRWMSREVRAAGGLMMANSVPYRFGFLMPWIDVAGTEANWNPSGEYSPDTDATMNLRRTLSAQKPYLLLQNTDFNKFSHDLVRRYMERCLFYGVFPSFFSLDAATDVYWANPKLLDRDRDLFKKYVPVVRQVAEAGWQPVTRATSDNKAVWIERFGADSALYLTLRNDASTRQSARITLDKELRAKPNATEVLGDATLAIKDGVFTVELQPDQTLAVRLR